MEVANKPIKQFLFISLFVNTIQLTHQTAENISCGEKWSCEAYTKNTNETGSYFADINCHCDDLCSLFHDCCLDASTTPEIFFPVLNDFPQESISCISFKEVTKEDSVYIVAKCPSSWNDSRIRSLCEDEAADDILLRLPVTGHRTSLLYENMYCAICHKTAYTYWIPSAYCRRQSADYSDIPPNATIIDIVKYEGCGITFFPPNNSTRFRPCLGHVINNKCDSTFNKSETVDLCEKTDDMAMVYSAGRAWRNVKCAECNFQTSLQCSPMFFSLNPTSALPGPYSLTVLLDLNTGFGSSTVGTESSSVTKSYTEQYSCDHNEVYDPFVKQCRQVICGDLMTYTGSGCSLQNMTSGYSNISDCPRIELNETEFNLVGKGQLVELVTGRRYDESEFVLRGTSAFVCSNFTQNHTEVINVDERIMVVAFSPTEGIVTAAGLSISLLALTVTFVVYATIRPLRNVPGKTLLSLSGSLFISELLLLTAPFAESVPLLCKAVAIAMHYFFLVAFLWMNVMSVDVYLTFSKGFVKSDASSKSTRRFCFYSIYSWGASALVTSASVMANHLPSLSPFKPDYGVRLCWFGNKKALLLFFGGPLLLVMLLNTAFFTAAVKNIYFARRSSRRYLQQKDPTAVFVYIRLFLVMGLTWISGFLATFVPHPVLWYLFAALNSLQGLFIMLSFVTTKRVIHLAKLQVMGSKPSSESRASTGTSTRSISRSDPVENSVQLRVMWNIG